MRYGYKSSVDEGVVSVDALASTPEGVLNSIDCVIQFSTSFRAVTGVGVFLYKSWFTVSAQEYTDLRNFHQGRLFHRFPKNAFLVE